MMQEKEVKLYGGAITCVIPVSASDMSDFRQIPDTQEVYTEVETGMCIIVELLARQREVCNDACGEYYLTDLAKANGCNSSQCSTQPQRELLPSDYPGVSQPPAGSSVVDGRQCAFGCLISSRQRISKFTGEQGKENDVLVMLAVLRFEPPISTDVLISVSAPQWVHPESSEARVVERLRSEEEVAAVLQRLLLTFAVKDWGLFVPEE